MNYERSGSFQGFSQPLAMSNEIAKFHIQYLIALMWATLPNSEFRGAEG